MKNLNNSGIYMILNLINNKCYVGSSCHLSRRKSRHFSRLKQNKHVNDYLQNSYNKHKEDAFKFIILENNIETKNLFNREHHWIILKDSFNKEKGYNLCLPNKDDSGYIITDYIKEKLRQKLYEQLMNKGKTLPKYKQWRDDVEKEKVRKANYIKPEISINSTEVLVLEKTTGIILQEFKSKKLAAEHFKVTTEQIRRVTNGDYKTLKGFILINKEDYNDKKDYKILPKEKKPRVSTKKPYKGFSIIRTTIDGLTIIIHEKAHLAALSIANENSNMKNIKNKINECCRGVRKTYKGYTWRYNVT